MKFRKHPVWLILLFFVVSSCNEINTSDAEEVYTRWAGDSIHEGVEILDGAYWESAHWSKEYVVYMKLKPSQAWWTTFRDGNNLQAQRIDNLDISRVSIFKIESPEWLPKPAWFTPAVNSEVYGKGDSKYFWDAKKGVFFVYEIQL